MEILCVIEKKFEPRQFDNRHGGKTDAVDVILKSGSDRMLGSAFDDQAKAIIEGKIPVGALVKANCILAVRETEKGCFQGANIIRIEPIGTNAQIF